MLDHIHIHEDRSPRHVDIRSDFHEHRAPIDESIRLLSEMQKAARDSVIESGNLGNEINGQWSVFRDFARATEIAVCRFSINGKEHRIEFEMPSAHSAVANQSGRLRHIFEKVVERVSAELCVSLAKELPC